MLLDPYIAPGCIVLFDDLVNYPDYREHEIRALWEWLEASKRQVEVRHADILSCLHLRHTDCFVRAQPCSLHLPLVPLLCLLSFQTQQCQKGICHRMITTGVISPSHAHHALNIA